MGAKRLVICVLVGWLLLQGPVASSAGPALTPGPAPHPGGKGHPHLQADARNVELVGQIGGATDTVAVQGRYAYIGLGPRLAVVDISNPARPTLVGQSAILPDLVEDVAVSGTLAYVADGDGGLRVIDVSNSAAPHEVGYYDTPGWAEGVAVSGTLVYVADGGGGLAILRYVPPGRVSLFLPLALKGR